MATIIKINGKWKTIIMKIYNEFKTIPVWKNS